MNVQTTGAALDAVLADAVAAQDVPFAVAMVADRDGVRWQGAAGEAAPGRPAGMDTAFRIFSMTKAIGSMAAMILIERGTLSPDTPVAEVLPEFAELQVLDGWDGDAPRMRPQTGTVTARHLATHTSGLCYEFWNPDVPRWMEATGHPSILAGTKAAMRYPLMFDPGARWDYGIGIDWLGLMVEAIDGRRIDAFCREEILDPLGMTDTAFEPDAMADRLCQVHMRGEDGGFGPFELAPPPRPEVYGMGHCLYSTAPDYLRFCRAVLNGGALDGTRIISEETLGRLTENQIGDLRIEPMTSVAPPVSADFAPFPGVPKTHSFAFMRVEGDVPGMRRAGSSAWAGVCNTHYWIDPASGLTAVLMTQSLPFVEPGLMRTYEAFERAVYAG